MRRRLTGKARRFAALACLAIGLWQVGEAAWIHAKASLAQVLLRQAWREAEAGADRPRPWPWADTWPVARLLVPDHGIDQVILAGASGSALAFGPGHLDGTAMPGSPGLSVIGGHRDTHFAFLRHLQPGDRVVSESPVRGRQAWRVTGTQIVNDPNVRLPEWEGQGLTLVTCYPFDTPVPGGPQRYLVWLEPVPPDMGELAMSFAE